MNARNSDIVVDFNAEINGAMNGITTQEGRELKLAVSIYLSPEQFNLNDMLGSEKVGDKIMAALSTNSQAFADKASKLIELKKEAKDASLARKTAIAFEREQIEKAVAGARTMMHRALQSAYYLRHVNASIKKLSSSNVAIEWDRGAIPETNADRIIKEQLTRKDLHDRGVKALKDRGLVKSRDTSGKSKPAVDVKAALKSVNTVSDGMKVLNETVAAYNGKQRDELISDKHAIALLATLLHKTFAHEGSIDIADVTRFIRENVSNVTVATASGSMRGQKAA